MGEHKKTQQNQMLRAYMTCRDALVRSLLKMRAKQEDVDDILQETFLRAMNAEKKTTIKSHQGYLFSVSRNLVLEKLTVDSREITMEINDALLDNAEVSAERRMHYRQKFEQFNEALRALPEKKRQAILLRKFYGLSHREIAKKMGVSIPSVEKYIASGIKQCKRTLMVKGYEFEGYGQGRQAKQRRETIQEAIDNTSDDSGKGL